MLAIYRLKYANIMSAKQLHLRGDTCSSLFTPLGFAWLQKETNLMYFGFYFSACVLKAIEPFTTRFNGKYLNIPQMVPVS